MRKFKEGFYSKSGIKVTSTGIFLHSFFLVSLSLLLQQYPLQQSVISCSPMNNFFGKVPLSLSLSLVFSLAINKELVSTSSSADAIFDVAADAELCCH